MGIEDMHYDMNFKLNKLDSSQYKNLEIPEKDWVLNSACRLFVKMVAEPRLRSHLGVEVTQRSIDDIRTLVEREYPITLGTNNIGALPDNYWFYLSGYILMSRGSCTGVKGDVFIRQHDDRFERSPFDASSFDWRTVNAVFYDGGIKFFTDGVFTLGTFYMDYIRQPIYMHNAKDFLNGNYRLPSGRTFSGHVDCELPDHTHEEIVDLAVLIASGAIQLPQYGTIINQLKLNNLN